MVKLNFFLSVLIMLGLSGCAKSNVELHYNEITPYKEYENNIARSETDVPLNWETILSQLSLENKEEYSSYYELKYGEKYEDINNVVEVFNEIKLVVNDYVVISNCNIEIQLSYGAEIYSAKITDDTKEYYDVFYYPEALIGIHFINSKDDNELNVLYFSIDEEIVGESGEWFLDDISVRDEFAQFYFSEMTMILGKS